MEWKDVTSYSQNDKKHEPRTFEMRAAGVRIIVTRHIYHGTSAWVLKCNPWFDMYEVGNGTAEEAKTVALALVRTAVAKAAAALTPNSN